MLLRLQIREPRHGPASVPLPGGSALQALVGRWFRDVPPWHPARGAPRLRRRSPCAASHPWRCGQTSLLARGDLRSFTQPAVGGHWASLSPPTLRIARALPDKAPPRRSRRRAIPGIAARHPCHAALSHRDLFCSIRHFLSVSRRITKEEFLQRCRQHHGDRYDYSRVDYVDTLHKITIICPEHGPFQQLAYMHMGGHGCRRCSQQRLHVGRRTSFAEVETAVHARFPHYQLDRSTFTGASELVEIYCRLNDHRFQAQPLVLARHGWAGCPECRVESRRKKRSAERLDPDAERHLRRIADELSDFYAETYRLWLAGETLWDIGRRYGITAEAVRLRLKRVGELLGTGTPIPGD